MTLRMGRARGGRAEACRILAARSKRFLATCRIGLDIEGALPPRGTGCIVCYNETSLADVFAVTIEVLPHCDRIAAAEVFARIPFARGACRTTAIEIVPRGNRSGTDALMDRMVPLVQGGERLLWGGEGRLSACDGVLRFKTGSCLIAIRAGVPVVPVAIFGGHACLPVGSVEATPGQISIHIGHPIPTDGLGEDDARDLADRVQATVTEMYEAMRAKRGRMSSPGEGR